MTPRHHATGRSRLTFLPSLVSEAGAALPANLADRLDAVDSGLDWGLEFGAIVIWEMGLVSQRV
jgi:hypothetical protein